MDIAGPDQARSRRSLRWAWSLTAKTGLLAVIFLLVPVFLYIEFRNAYEESQELLLRSVRDEGRVISQSLLPLLQTADIDSLPQLGSTLARFAGEVTTIKLLLAPVGAGGDGFYYVASWPSVEPANLQAERNTLAQQGVLDRLAQNCRGEIPFSLIYHRPTGGAEIVHCGDPAGDRGGVLGGGLLVFTGRLSGSASRPALLGDAAGADRGGDLSGDGGDHLFDPA